MSVLTQAGSPNTWEAEERRRQRRDEEGRERRREIRETRRRRREERGEEGARAIFLIVPILLLPGLLVYSSKLRASQNESGKMAARLCLR